MRTVYILMVTLVCWSRAAVVPEVKDLNKRDSQDQELTSKLAKIKALLQELQDKEDGHPAHQETKTTTQPPSLVELKEPMREEEGVWLTDDDRNKAMTAQDLRTLKQVKAILEKMRRKNEETVEQPITADSSEDLDSLDDKAYDRSEISWRALASKLESERDQLYLQRQNNDNRHIKVKTITNKGEFVPFKDEIKASVEKNLMTDLALAVHSGISVEEIIQDLTDRAHSTD